MNKQEANAKIAELIKEAGKLIADAEALADTYGLMFSSPVGAYGMGGDYYGKGTTDYPAESWYPSTDDGWQSSSASC